MSGLETDTSLDMQIEEGQFLVPKRQKPTNSKIG